MLKRTLSVLKHKSKEVSAAAIVAVIATGTMASVSVDKVKLDAKTALVYSCGDSQIAKLILQEQMKISSIANDATNALAQTYTSLVHGKSLEDFFVNEARESYIQKVPKSTIGAESYFETIYKNSQEIAKKNTGNQINEIFEKHGISKDDLKESFVKSYEARGKAVMLSKTTEIVKTKVLSFEDFKKEQITSSKPEELEVAYSKYLDLVRNTEIAKKEAQETIYNADNNIEVNSNNNLSMR